MYLLVYVVLRVALLNYFVEAQGSVQLYSDSGCTTAQGASVELPAEKCFNTNQRLPFPSSDCPLAILPFSSFQISASVRNHPYYQRLTVVPSEHVSSYNLTVALDHWLSFAMDQSIPLQTSLLLLLLLLRRHLLLLGPSTLVLAINL